MGSLKNSALGSFIVLNVIAAMLFIAAKQSAIFTSEQLNSSLQNVKQSAISDHLLDCHCNINFKDFTILFKDSNNFNLLIKESLLIARNKLILNKPVKSFPLELFE